MSFISHTMKSNIAKMLQNFHPVLLWCPIKYMKHTAANIFTSILQWGNEKAQLVEVLYYKPEGRGFDSRWCHWEFFFWHYTSQLTMALQLTKGSNREICTRNISWGVKTANAEDWPYHLHMTLLVMNLKASTSWNPQGLSRPIQGLIYLLPILQWRCAHCCFCIMVKVLPLTGHEGPKSE